MTVLKSVGETKAITLIDYPTTLRPAAQEPASASDAVGVGLRRLARHKVFETCMASDSRQDT